MENCFEKVFNICCDILKELLNIDDEISLKSTLKYDLGMESMSYIAFLVELEKAFDMTMDDSMLELKDDSNLEQLVKHICSAINMQAKEFNL